MGLKVNWGNTSHIDGIHRSHGFAQEDTLNGIGLKRWVLRYPRGKDGKSTAVEEITYTLRGSNESLTHFEMVAKLKELGLWQTPVETP